VVFGFTKAFALTQFLTIMIRKTFAKISVFLFLLTLTLSIVAQKNNVITGAERMAEYLPLLKGKSVAVFANQTSVVGHTHLIDTLLSKGVVIRKIFAPEHGFRGNADAGEKVQNSIDQQTGIPVISLYGSKTKPAADQLQDVDIIVFDIQDVGVRFYTFISSLQDLMESAILYNKPLIVLDRPNPNGFYVDGPVLDKKFKSFVGMQSVPVVYGMTIGEYAKMLAGEKWFDASVNQKISSFKLTVITCKNYTHKTNYTLPVKPSPNLPNAQSVYLYPSLCFFEGTQISLGRGTDKPFQIFGSPEFPTDLFSFTPQSVEGAKNPPLLNQKCYGYDLSKVDALREIDGKLQLKWLLKAYSLYKDKDKFFLSNNFFNKLAGNDVLMQQIKDGKTEKQIRESWDGELNKFKSIRKRYLLYAE
jgi:uncharacterized protein YbbC (DUF1343 family)